MSHEARVLDVTSNQDTDKESLSSGQTEHARREDI
jgi:hypothetical protein